MDALRAGNEYLRGISGLILSGGLSLAALAWGAEASHGQSITSLERLRCDGCSIVRQRTITLGSADDSTSVVAMPRVVRIANGELAAFGVLESTSLLVYSPAGRLSRVVGRHGSGPGEFSELMSAAAMSGDSMVVVDFRGRAVVYDRDWQAVRSVRFMPAPQQLLTVGRFFIAAGRDGTPEGAGYPLRAHQPDATVHRRFGTDQPVLDPRSRFAIERRLARAPNGFWTAPVYAYELQEWSINQDPLRTFVRAPNSDNPLELPSITIEANEVRPVINGIAFDNATDQMWVAILVPDPSGIGGASVGGPGSANALWNTVLEVVDLTRGGIVASLTIPEFVYGFAAPGEVVVQNDVGNGFEAVQLHLFALRTN